MDILLTHGYFLQDDPHEQRIMKPYAPLGILYISAYLKAQGFGVQVFDTTFAQWDDFTAYIEREQPSLVGIYVNMMTKRTVLRMIAWLKARHTRVVLGGPDAPHYAREYLAHGADVIVRGEGELTLAELIPHLARHGLAGLESVAGIAFINGDGILTETAPRPMIADLSANPWPDREAIDLEKYLSTWQTHHGQRSISVIHARGCPYTCTWCSHSVFGHTHRRRTPEDAADELLWIKERYAPDVVWYADDVFGINHRWLSQYAEALKARNLRLPFECISRADRLTQPVVDMLAEMGCYRLWNGSESGSQPMLNAMQRKVTVDDVQAKTHMLQRAGIETGMFIMLGYHGETIQDIVDTVEHLKACNPDIFLTTVAYPIKGTPYYAEVSADILRTGTWAENADRDLTVAGRHSRRFYSFATRWMVSEVALHRARTRGGVGAERRLKLWANARIGRIGMHLSQHERENRGVRIHQTAGEPAAD